jgi:hypothetical protein
VGLADLAGFDAVRDRELAQHVRHMHADRLAADEQGLGDVAVAATAGQLSQHFDFAPGQAEFDPGRGVPGRTGARRLSAGRVERFKPRSLGQLRDSISQRGRAELARQQPGLIEAVGWP